MYYYYPSPPPNKVQNSNETNNSSLKVEQRTYISNLPRVQSAIPHLQSGLLRQPVVPFPPIQQFPPHPYHQHYRQDQHHLSHPIFLTQQYHPNKSPTPSFIQNQYLTPNPILYQHLYQMQAQTTPTKVDMKIKLEEQSEDEKRLHTQKQQQKVPIVKKSIQKKPSSPLTILKSLPCSSPPQQPPKKPKKKSQPKVETKEQPLPQMVKFSPQIERKPETFYEILNTIRTFMNTKLFEGLASKFAFVDQNAHRNNPASIESNPLDTMAISNTIPTDALMRFSAFILSTSLDKMENIAEYFESVQHLQTQLLTQASFTEIAQNFQTQCSPLEIYEAFSENLHSFRNQHIQNSPVMYSSNIHLFDTCAISFLQKQITSTKSRKPTRSIAQKIEQSAPTNTSQNLYSLESSHSTYQSQQPLPHINFSQECQSNQSNVYKQSYSKVKIEENYYQSYLQSFDPEPTGNSHHNHNPSILQPCLNQQTDPFAMKESTFSTSKDYRTTSSQLQQNSVSSSQSTQESLQKQILFNFDPITLTLSEVVVSSEKESRLSSQLLKQEYESNPFQKNFQSEQMIFHPEIQSQTQSFAAESDSPTQIASFTQNLFEFYKQSKPNIEFLRTVIKFRPLNEVNLHDLDSTSIRTFSEFLYTISIRIYITLTSKGIQISIKEVLNRIVGDLYEQANLIQLRNEHTFTPLNHFNNQKQFKLKIKHHSFFKAKHCSYCVVCSKQENHSKSKYACKICSIKTNRYTSLCIENCDTTYHANPQNYNRVLKEHTGKQSKKKFLIMNNMEPIKVQSYLSQIDQVAQTFPQLMRILNPDKSNLLDSAIFPTTYFPSLESSQIDSAKQKRGRLSQVEQSLHNMGENYPFLNLNINEIESIRVIIDQDKKNRSNSENENEDYNQQFILIDSDEQNPESEEILSDDSVEDVQKGQQKNTKNNHSKNSMKATPSNSN